MSSENKRIDIKEFREQGFLQEANRLFFHPHGLALEVTIADEAIVALGVTPEQLERLRVVAGVAMPDLAEALDRAVTYDAGDAYISGCWDSDDPEGVVFGDGYDGKVGNVDRVAARRAEYCEHRCLLFGVGPDTPDGDIEPVDWVYPA